MESFLSLQNKQRVRNLFISKQHRKSNYKRGFRGMRHIPFTDSGHSPVLKIDY